jgi:hypothetical protein
MKIEPRRASLAEEAAHQEDTTPEIFLGTEHRAHRRTTVTVERETLSILMRRPVAGPVAESAAQPAEGETVPETSEEPGKNLPATPPALRNEFGGGKP